MTDDGGEVYGEQMSLYSKEDGVYPHDSHRGLQDDLENCLCKTDPVIIKPTNHFSSRRL